MARAVKQGVDGRDCGCDRGQAPAATPCHDYNVAGALM